jgi:tripartite-type tricarboxylate transporter receptor subunit TctC
MKRFPRRQFLHLAAGAAALPVLSPFAWAQVYPTRPITLIVPSTPGDSTDAVARVLAERMRRSLGQPIVIENVAGISAPAGPLAPGPMDTRLTLVSYPHMC